MTTTPSTKIQEPRTGIPDGRTLVDGLIYHREKHTSALTVVDRDHISLILQ
ncbi:hypothetical protein O181_116435, partial [Austropuccinia psidii MF-1]|nr:hypothetical protein [Austropuccinia psidii MF-1]